MLSRSGDITATVTVTDNGDGTLGTTVTYNPTDAKITNSYKAEGDAELEAIKAIEGAEWPENGSVTFTVSGAEPLPETPSVTLNAPGTAEFGKISYKLEDLGGAKTKDFVYTISEEATGFNGWTGSGDITATVTVTDKGNGTLDTSVRYSPENATITNEYRDRKSTRLNSSHSH